MTKECYVLDNREMYQWQHISIWSRLEADIFSGIPRDGKQNRYELRDWDGTGKYLIGSGRDRE